MATNSPFEPAASPRVADGSVKRNLQAHIRKQRAIAKKRAWSSPSRVPHHLAKHALAPGKHR